MAQQAGFEPDPQLTHDVQPGGGHLAVPLPLRRRMADERFAARSVLVRAGAPMTRLYLVLSGTVRVLLHSGADALELARLGPGAWLGETALLTGAPSSATVVAETEVHALTVSQEDFLAAADEDPSIFREIARVLAQRLRTSDRLLDSRGAARLVILNHAPEHASLAASVLEECSRWSPTPYVGVAAWPQATQYPPISRYLEEPARLSGLHDRVAAGVMTIVSTDDVTNPELAAFVSKVSEFTALITVASRHQSSTLPHDGLVSHVIDEMAPGDRRTWRLERFDPGRVARWICRQQVGLALGGGAARGYAHVGVLRVLAEAGVDVDVVTGTSVGAPIAAAVASGMDIDEIGRTIGSVGRLALVPQLLPAQSIFSNALLGLELRRHLPETFEELNVPAGAVATDLHTTEEVVYSSGALVPALLGSMALPGILPPVRHEGRLLVDGGLRAPVPVRACRGLGAAIVISSQMRVEESNASGHAPPIPWLPELVTRAIDVMQEQLGAENSAGADVAIETSIPSSQAGLFDFSHRQATEAAGEAAARAALAPMLERLRGAGRAQQRAA